MRLAIPSLVLFIYLVASLILFVPCRPLIKVMVTIALFGVCLKFLIYEQIGGSFIAPELPRLLLLAMEVLYGSAIILAFLLVLKDGLAVLLWLSRCLGSSWHLPFTPAMRSGGLALVGAGSRRIRNLAVHACSRCSHSRDRITRTACEPGRFLHCPAY